MSCDAILVDGVAHVRGEFRNAETKLLADPSNITFQWINPTDYPSTSMSGVYTYSTGTGDIVRSSTGLYYVDLNTTEEGRWYYRWLVSGLVNGSFEGSFEVEPSEFAGRST